MKSKTYDNIMGVGMIAALAGFILTLLGFFGINLVSSFIGLAITVIGLITVMVFAKIKPGNQ